MKKEIAILLTRYGSIEKVADVLGVTKRHVQNVLSGKRVGKSLTKLIETKAKLVGIEDI